MFPKIKLLFVGAPSVATIEHQKLLATGSLPVSGHFEATAKQAVAYLHSKPPTLFPDVIFLDEKMGKIQLDFFFQCYRKFFYMHQLDTMILIFTAGNADQQIRNTYPKIAGCLHHPLNKATFLKEIYSRISFTLV